MSLDPRSRERLEALGRRLPQKLPSPGASPAEEAATAAPAAPPAGTGAARHALETEDNPESLFRALMQASPDGSVPPHLLERLRQLEQSRPGAAVVPTAAADAERLGPKRSPASQAPASRRRRPDGAAKRPPVDPGEGDLYAAFDDLLGLEDEEDPPPPTPLRPIRPSEPRLLPRPSLRRQ